MNRPHISSFISGSIVLLGNAAVLYGFVQRSPQWGSYFAKYAFWIMALLVLSWIAAFLAWAAQRRPHIVALFRTEATGVLLTLALSALIFVTVEPQLRIFNDEPLLMAASRSMAENFRADVVTQTTLKDGRIEPFWRFTDKRLPLFPFALHLLHRITGYRIANVFALNFICLWTLLALIYVRLRRTRGDAWAIAAVVATMAQPIVSLSAASGGYELFTFLLMVLSFFALEAFLKDGSTRSFSMLWTTLMMLANTRYEAWLYTLLTAVLLMITRRIRAAHLAGSPAFWATPIFLLPVIWQNAAWSGHLKTLFQTPTDTAVFSLKAFAANNILFFKKLFDFRCVLPYADALNILGIIALPFFVSAVFRRQRNAGVKLLWACAGICLGASWIIFTSYHEGMMDSPLTARYYLPFCVVLSLAAVWLLTHVPVLTRQPRIAAAICILLFAMYHPIATHRWIYDFRAGYTRNNQLTMSFLRGINDRNILLVVRFANQYVIHGYAAVEPSYLRNTRDHILQSLRDGKYSAVYVLREEKSGGRIEQSWIEGIYRTQTVWKIQNRPRRMLVASKILGAAAPTRPTRPFRTKK